MIIKLCREFARVIINICEFYSIFLREIIYNMHIHTFNKKFYQEGITILKPRRIFAVLFVLLICTVSSADEVYDSKPSYYAPYYPGVVKSSVLNDALDELNYIRNLIGVPDNVTLNAEYTNKAQHAAVLLDLIDKLTHTPSKPYDLNKKFYDLAYEGTTHSNLSERKLYVNNIPSGSITLSSSLKLFMHDSDSANIRSLGHRRWLMNPRLRQTGFGISTRRGYAAVYVIEEFSKSRTLPPNEYKKYLKWLKWPIKDEFITWPVRKKYHPLTYFENDSAWSVTLNKDIFDSCKENAINITLTRRSDNKSWHFNSSRRDGYFTVNKENIAYDECIIFRPDNISSYKDGETWDVNITGLKRKNGSPVKISYSVRFTNSLTGYEEDDNIFTELKGIRRRNK